MFRNIKLSLILIFDKEFSVNLRELRASVVNKKP